MKRLPIKESNELALSRFPVVIVGYELSLSLRFSQVMPADPSLSKGDSSWNRIEDIGLICSFLNARNKTSRDNLVFLRSGHDDVEPAKTRIPSRIHEEKKNWILPLSVFSIFFSPLFFTAVISSQARCVSAKKSRSV